MSSPKRRYSGFFGTDLDITLREREVDTLRLVGDCTNICVLYTAADARNLGYAVEGRPRRRHVLRPGGA
jgi:nicotinamidase-related amidase